MEHPFDELEGVHSTTVGYTGGQTQNPTYLEVSRGRTGHAEAVEILFNPSKVTFEKLLEIFWRNIDPTTKNRQFADQGTQYRTAIYYHDEIQKKIALESVADLERRDVFKGKIVTEVAPATDFYSAEEYHQDYYKKQPIQYKIYRVGSGREDYLKRKWGQKPKA